MAEGKGEVEREKTTGGRSDTVLRIPSALSASGGDAAAPAPGVLNGLAAAAIIIAALYFGRDLLMPLALAVLLAFVLNPVVTQLKRWGAPRGLAVFIVVLTTLAVLAATSTFVVSQLRALGQDLPSYQGNIRTKLGDLRKNLSQPGMFDQLSRVFGTVEGELAAAQRELQGGKEGANAPTRVEVVPSPPSPLQRMAEWLNRIATPAATLGIVLVFAVLILFDRGDLRDRCLRLLGGNLHRTTDALNEAGRRVSRYLSMQLVVNAGYGLPLAAGLALIGVPGALLWGLLAGVLRFVPYAGPMIAAVFPLTIAFAVDPGWNMLLWTLGLILALELLSNNVVEPWLYGNSTGLSALSLIMAATFWTAIWGPAGLMLSTPLTVVLLVLGQYLPQLRFMNVLLGNEPPLSMSTRLYQRLLAGDADEAVDLAMEQAEERSPLDFYEDAARPALLMATSAHHTVATAEHRHRVISGMRRLIDEMREEFSAADAGDDAVARVMCIGGRWEVDLLAADMLAHALALDGCASRVAPAASLSSRFVDQLDLQDVEVVCLSYFSPAPTTHARSYVRRLRRRWPHVDIVLALWNAPQLAAEAGVAERLDVQAVVTTMSEALARTETLLAEDAARALLPAPLPDNEEQRLAALARSAVLDDALSARFDVLAQRAAEVFDCARAQLSILDAEWQRVRGDSTASRDAAAAPVERSQSMCAHVVAADAALVIDDVRRDSRFAANPVLLARHSRFYAGAPLRDEEGFVLGALELFDSAPRSFSVRDRMLLETMTIDAMAAVAAIASPVDEAAVDAAAS